MVGAFSTYAGLAVVSLVVPGVWLGAVLALPETPVFLLKKRRPADAERSLRWLRGPGYQGIRREMADIQRDLDQAARNEASLG